MEKAFKTFEKGIVLSLLGLMMLAVTAYTIELMIVFVQEMLRPPRFLLNLEKILEFFGLFLMVFIGLELLESIKAYLDKDRVRVEVVMLVALIAIARKVIILDYTTSPPEILYGIAAIIFALGVSYFLVRHALGNRTVKPPPGA